MTKDEGSDRPVLNGQFRPRNPHHLGIGAAVALTIALFAGCSGNGADDASREAAIYRAVIAHLAEDYAPEPLGPDENPILYVASFALDGVSLEDQVELVAAFDDDYEVRFVDDQSEAVDDDLENRPVRPGSALLGLGTIVDDGLSTVRVELYADEMDIRGFRFSVRAGAEGWEVVGEPEPVVPEGFVAS